MNYAVGGLLVLTFVALWYVFGLFVGRLRLSRRLALNRSRLGVGEDGHSFVDDYRAGLSSQNFDISINIEDGDSRPGLDSDEVRHIMKSQGVTFDKARLIRQQQLMKHNGIDPSTGLSLDPKAVTFGR
ncbi:hypothetical protein GGI02_003811 [Coemansia sp. RSA 2322]|uniref:Uncharacterized protein n=1 Tax=Coemansia thaxteri TaxID=2663907 RepID=A0A9W8BD56_9FUNG|nr:hypothetical protein H4R26_004210 [Coemansia thaxteri]KAJ2468070.1 hypothetical protein GGI02_003811 [Coemansia sp. RSA 2322]KAJ2484761.1 hypothetical protein EV174_002183 [Coemansia sp. RSA 2320]